MSRNEEGGDGTLGDRGGGVLGTWEKLAGYLRGRVSSRLSDTFRSVGFSDVILPRAFPVVGGSVRGVFQRRGRAEGVRT
ncbi:MAG TPA: hypothetical protein P5033_12335 [Anaerohalosphaeraceae bacterium]|nr:hypothetical protein [Anaerohalosphaeraceae bacterium]